MSTLNGDQSQSAMEEIIDSGLTAEIKPNSKKRVLSKGDARYWLEGGATVQESRFRRVCLPLHGSGTQGAFQTWDGQKKTAAAKAAAVYCTIQSKGWEVALAQFKPKTSEQGREATQQARSLRAH
jgi:hypothetical protein